MDSILHKFSASVCVMNPLNNTYDMEKDLEAFRTFFKRMRIANNLKVIGIGQGATFVNKAIAPNAEAVAGIVTIGGKSGKYKSDSCPVPVFMAGSGSKQVANAYVKLNKAVKTAEKEGLTFYTNSDEDLLQVVVSSNVDAFLCLFDKNGLIKELSKLLIDEELEIIEIAKGLEYYKLDYSYIDNNNEINRYLRSEKKVINKIINLLKTIKEENNENLLKYLYYEWFLKSPKSKNYYNKLINDIKKEYSPKHKQFLEIINITSK